MGTRADFYDKDMQWLGSIGWDGYPNNDEFNPIFDASTYDEYLAEVAKLLTGCEDATLPKDGWPWPWEDSSITDFAYKWDGSHVVFSNFGKPWQGRTDAPFDGDVANMPSGVFPNMKHMQKVTLGARSGLIVFGGKS